MGKNEMVEAARPVLLDGGDGVRLLALHSAQPEGTARAAVLLIHGWEGSSDSTYIQRTGRILYRQGYNVIRLNLRDHGASHHLNEGMFNGTLIEETATAVQAAARLSSKLPFFVAGFSLGGNFALRIALDRNGASPDILRQVIAVSPLIDPYRSTVLIDRLPLYRYYFLRKWKRSLRLKQKLFPHLYELDDLLSLDSTMEITDRLIRRYTDFGDCRSYFSHYTLDEQTLQDLAVPATIIAAADDPVIPVDDVAGVAGSELLRLSIQRWGGHCGFIESLTGRSWYEEVIIGIIQETTGELNPSAENL